MWFLGKILGHLPSYTLAIYINFCIAKLTPKGAHTLRAVLREAGRQGLVKTVANTL